MEITQANHCIVLYVQYPIPAMPKATFIESAIFPEVFPMFTGLRKQATFCNANTGFPSKCHEEMLPGSVWCFKLVCCVRNLLQPIQSTKSYFISVYTPLCTIIAEQCQCLSTSSTPCFHTIPLANPLNLIQYSSLPRTFSKRLAKCLSCLVLFVGVGH